MEPKRSRLESLEAALERLAVVKEITQRIFDYHTAMTKIVALLKN